MDHTISIRRLYDLINAGDIDGFGRQLGVIPGAPPA